MKIYLMTDMEGVAGILNSEDWCQPTGRYYDQGKELLTMEVNAAIEGLLAAGATEIVVSDGHGPGGIHPAMLDERVRLLRGWPRGWPFELDDSYDAVAWVGQHAKAGTPFAHLAHTQSFRYIDQSINDQSVGEFGQFALCAGELGVPVVFGSGDEAFCREAEALAPGMVTVSVKQGLAPSTGDDLDLQAYAHKNTAAIHLHPAAARRAIREGAKRALERLRAEGSEGRIVRLEPPYERVTVLCPEEPGQPKQRDRAVHACSVIAVLNAPFCPEPVAE